MVEPELIRTLAGALAAALVLGYVTHRLGLSPIVGYLLAGIVVGSNTPGFVADQHLAEQMAEIGVILLMFGVGMHFRISELLAVRRIALPGAIFQSVVATGLGAISAYLFGWGWTAGAVFGMALSVASTVVLTRVLSDSNELHTPIGHIAIGWLVVEDLFTVLVLVLMPALFGPVDDSTPSLPIAILIAGLKIAGLVVLTFVIGGRVVPWLLERIADTKSRELFTLTVLVVALGIAVGSTRIFGVSMALGAFLAGMIVGRSEYSLRAAADALPMRDAFAVLFFVSVGMLFEPQFLIDSPGIVLVTLAVVVIGKPLSAILIVLLLHYPVRVALGVAVALAQIGEFSFIVATTGKMLHVLPEGATNALVAVAIISISINPILYRLVTPLERWLTTQPRLWAWLNSRVAKSTPTDPKPADPMMSSSYRAVVIGYGPVGQAVVRLLRENGIQPTIIEMNLETVRRLNREGIPAIYGDASQQTTLIEAGMRDAASLIISASGVSAAREVVRLARELNPEVRVLARSAYLRERSELRAAGADLVYSGEGEVALAMTESILRTLGATAEQIDRERERVRADLFGQAQPEAPIQLPDRPGNDSQSAS